MLAMLARRAAVELAGGGTCQGKFRGGSPDGSAELASASSVGGRLAANPRRGVGSGAAGAEDRVEQAGKALVEGCAAEPVEPVLAVDPLRDHPRLAQHAE